jgi:hypothetical protein
MGEVLEQSACDDPDMDKIMVCVGLLYPYDQKPPLRPEAVFTWPARSDGNGKQEPVKMGTTGYTLRSPAGAKA